MGRRLALGPTHVGPTIQQVGGDADGRLRRRGRDGRLAKTRRQGFRRRASQFTKPVARLPQTDFERRDGGLRLGQVGAGLLEVQGGGPAVIDARLDDAQRSLLNRDVAVGVSDPLLKGADLHVSGRHLGRKSDESVMVVLNRGVARGVGRLDAATDAPPEVEFPRSVQSRGPNVERMRRAALRRHNAALSAKYVGGLANLRVDVGDRRALRLGQQVAGRDVALPAPRRCASPPSSRPDFADKRSQ